MNTSTTPSLLPRLCTASSLALLVTLAGCASAPLRQHTAEMDVISALDLPADVTAPVAVRTVAPIHPYGALRAGVEGAAWVNCLIDENGEVTDAVVMEASFVDFGDAALDAVKKWSFTPAMRNGRPYAARVLIPFRFELNGSELPRR